MPRLIQQCTFRCIPELVRVRQSKKHPGHCGKICTWSTTCAGDNMKILGGSFGKTTYLHFLP